MKIAVILAAALLSGCSTANLLTNRVACTVDGKQAHYVSLYGPLGIASKVDESDAAVICKRPATP
jgi:hypothetical protein